MCTWNVTVVATTHTTGEVPDTGGRQCRGVGEIKSLKGYEHSNLKISQILPKTIQAGWVSQPQNAVHTHILNNS